MAMQTFIAVAAATLTADGTGTASYSVSNQEHFEVERIMFASTGAFSLTGIRDNAGNIYSNIDSTDPLPSTLLSSGANGNNHIGDFPTPIIVQGGGQVSIDLLDTSSAGNTVRIFLIGKREYRQ